MGLTQGHRAVMGVSRILAVDGKGLNKNNCRTLGTDGFGQQSSSIWETQKLLEPRRISCFLGK